MLLKLIMFITNLKNQLKSKTFSKLANKSIPSQSLVVEVSKVQSIDGVLDTYQERQEEVTEKLLVLVHGIQLTFNTPAHVLVKWVISTELKLTNLSLWSILLKMLHAVKLKWILLKKVLIH